MNTTSLIVRCASLMERVENEVAQDKTIPSFFASNKGTLLATVKVFVSELSPSELVHSLLITVICVKS